MNELRLILVSPEPLLCAEFREQFKELSNVEVVNGYFEQLPEFDCLVSPANSFGLMDGGISKSCRMTCVSGPKTSPDTRRGNKV